MPFWLTIAVTAVGDVFTDASETVSTAEDTPVSGNVLVNATDVDGDELTYSLVEGPAAEEGALTFNDDGSYSFVPAKDFNGEVRFTYKANDGAVDSNTASVTITVAMRKPTSGISQ